MKYVEGDKYRGKDIIEKNTQPVQRERDNQENHPEMVFKSDCEMSEEWWKG